jgi:hypothetical protein
MWRASLKTAKKIIIQKGVNRRATQIKPPVYESAQATDFVETLLNADRAFVLPRLIPDWVQPHEFPMTFTIMTQPGDYGALIVRPDMILTTEQFVTESSSGTSSGFSWQANGFQSGTNRESLGFAIPITGQALPFSTAPWAYAASSGYDRFNNSGDRVLGQIAYYTGNWTVPTGFNLTVYNPDSATMSITVGISSYDIPTGNVTDLVTNNANIAGHNQLNILLSPAGGATLITNMVLWFQITNSPVIGHVPSGLNIANSPPPALALSATGSWAMSDYIHFYNNSAITSQWDIASSYSVTAMSAVVTNVTPELSKGGSINVAQLPGGQLGMLPRTAQQVYNFLGGLQGRVYIGGELGLGGSWNYVPEKIQDWFFKPVPSGVVDPLAFQYIEDRPVAVFAWSTPPASGSAITPTVLQVTLKICVEYKTVDISAPLIFGCSDLEGLMQIYLALCSSEINVGCNPDHIKRVKDMVRRIVNNPKFREASKQVLKHAATMAMSSLGRAAMML